MIKQQQSDEQNEGFFKPVVKIVKLAKQIQKNEQKDQQAQQANNLVSKNRPTNYKCRILKQFNKLNQYPQYLLNDKCQQQSEQLVDLIKRPKETKRYMTLQEKYKNTKIYQQFYSKKKIQDGSDNNIFSLESCSHFSQEDYLQSQFNCQQQQNQHKIEQQSTDQFIFDSHFQSGNLMYAFKSLEYTVPTFDLIIQNDTNTHGYNQWFYFSIQRLRHSLNKTIQINIVNFIKKHLMFQNGVRPVLMHQNQKIWKFAGRQVNYKKSFLSRKITLNGQVKIKNYYTLSFLLDFQQSTNQNDKLFIALNYPYPYKRLINFIDTMVKDNVYSNDIQITKQTLCYSIGNNQVPYLKISQKITQKHILRDMSKKSNLSQIKLQKQQIQGTIINERNQTINKIQEKKKKIILLARQHPGQTVGSFVLQNFLRQLTLQKSQSSLKLLKQFTIYIIPMLNPDGVVYGNFRTNLSGSDLNRQWIQPSKYVHPQIYYLKNFIKKLRNIQFVLDFHGHSKKLNNFIYACNHAPPGKDQQFMHDQHLNQDQYLKHDISTFRLFPYIVSKHTDFFQIRDCTYTVSMDKYKTARINLFLDLDYMPRVFTFETGFFGYNRNSKKYRYKISDFYTIGKAVLQSVKCLLLKPKKANQMLKQVQAKEYLFDKWSFQNKQDWGSQSNPSQDQLNPIQIQSKVFSKTFKSLTKQRQKIQILERRKSKTKKKLNKNIDCFVKQIKTKTTLNLGVANSFNSGQKIKSLSGKNQRNKKITISDQLSRKKSQELRNTLVIKQTKIQKPPQIIIPSIKAPDIHLKAKNKIRLQQFKSRSNLLGTGISYFQHKSHHLMTQMFGQSPLYFQSLQKNNKILKKQVESLSLVLNQKQKGSVSKSQSKKIPFSPSPSQSNPLILKVQSSFLQLISKRNIKDVSHKAQTSQPKTNQQHKQRLYVIKENKIVKIVNSVNRKHKSFCDAKMFQNQLYQRRKSLRNCQHMMTDDKGLLKSIEEQIPIEQSKRKKVYLNPISYH